VKNSVTSTSCIVIYVNYEIITYDKINKTKICVDLDSIVFLIKFFNTTQ
jgi:hypothetical protein